MFPGDRLKYLPDLSQLNAFDRGRRYTVYLVKVDVFGFHRHYIVIVRVPIIADLLNQHTYGLCVVNFDGRQARLAVGVVRGHRTDEWQNRSGYELGARVSQGVVSMGAKWAFCRRCWARLGSARRARQIQAHAEYFKLRRDGDL